MKLTVKVLVNIARRNPVPIATPRGTDYVIQITPEERDALVECARRELAATEGA